MPIMFMGFMQPEVAMKTKGLPFHRGCGAVLSNPLVLLKSEPLRHIDVSPYASGSNNCALNGPLVKMEPETKTCVSLA